MERIYKDHSVGYFKIFGNFGEVYGDVTICDAVVYCDENVKVLSHTKEYDDGVFLRRDEVENISNKVIEITDLKSVFTYAGNDCEVYTQYNTWQHESTGNWAPLVSTISVSNESIRTSCENAPFLGLWDNQINRGMVYHLVPSGSWNISVSRKHAFGENNYISVEMGYESRRFSLSLKPGEKVMLPEILYYEVTNKTDLDAWKIHSYWNKTYPRREMPVVYNTWLARFDKLDYEGIKEQILLAEEIGAEYFVTDAGWFGYGDKAWSDSIGDWVENTQFGYGGRMKEVSELVRKHSMKFGLWLEPERALLGSKSYMEHPEYYITGSTISYGKMAYLDFSNPDARKFMIDLIAQLIERCKIKYIKFDCNMDLFHDVYKDAFISYFNGYNEFFECLRKMFPQVYWENCAGGGGRLDLANCKYHDSFWFTDNQNIYDSVNTLKRSLLRLPPQVIDRWITIGTISDATPSGEERIFSIGDAAWNHTVGVNESYLYGFLAGGPLGLSFDLTKVSKKVFEKLKTHIAKFKKERIFWKTANCRIVAEGSELFALQYSDEWKKKNVIQLFVNRNMQESIRIYPVLDPEIEYTLSDGTVATGKKLMDEGIHITIPKLFSVYSIVLENK